MPPIVGWDGMSTRFAGGLAQLPIGAIPASDLSAGIQFGIDLQPDRPSVGTLFEAVDSETQSSLTVDLNAAIDRTQVDVTLVDGAGRRLSATFETSRSAGKRLVCRIVPRQNVIRIYEIQPWCSGADPNPKYLAREGPRAFGRFPREIRLAGSGAFSGRAAEFWFRVGKYEGADVTGLKAASRSGRDWTLGPRLPTPELVSLFRTQLMWLRQVATNQPLTYGDFLRGSTVAYSWLLDRRPMLHLLQQGLGIQVALPCQTETSRAYEALVLSKAPIYMQRGAYMGGPLRADWGPIKRFLTDPAYFISGRAVSNRDFIEVVRNKMGGGHYDEERTPLQRDLLEAASSMRLAGEAALLYQMKMLLHALLVGAESSGLSSWLT